MKTLRMNLENIQGKMTRVEMRNIIGGAYWECTRNGGSFTTDSGDLAGAWINAWNSMGGNATCKHYYYDNQPRGYALAAFSNASVEDNMELKVL